MSSCWKLLQMYTSILKKITMYFKYVLLSKLNIKYNHKTQANCIYKLIKVKYKLDMWLNEYITPYFG